MIFAPSSVLHIVELLLVVQIIISSLEILKVRHILKDDNLLSWRIHRLNHPIIASVIKKSKIDFLFRYPNVLVLLILKILLAMILFVFIVLNYNTFMPLVFIAISTLLFILRSPQSNDGSDQMASILILTCVLAEGIPAIHGKEIAIAFIVGQSSLSYATSGFLKLTKIGWQNGNYVIEILKTSSFGNRYLLKLVVFRKWIAKFFGCSVAYGDSILAFSFLFPPKICLAFLSFGIMLHLGIGLVMGLNNFLWSFGACYPAIYFISTRIYG